MSVLRGAWHCSSARPAVLGAGGAPPLLDTGELVVGGTAACGRAEGGAHAVLAGQVTDPPRLRAAAGVGPGSSDADALAAGFARHGAAILDHLRGVWTVLLWQRERGPALLACDPLGGGGLHYAVRGGGIVFGQELRDVLALLPATPAPERAQVAAWLAVGTFRPDQMLHAGVRRLPGGTTLALAPGARPERFWDLHASRITDRSPDGAAHALRDAVDTAVRRVVCGRRTGVMLSGGLDSSTVAASAAAAGAPSRLGAYSGVFPDSAEADESGLIDLICAHVGLSSVRSTLRGGSALAAGLEHLEAWQLPLNTGMPFVWQPLLERAVGDGVEVIVNGEGGDEVFISDVTYLAADALRRGRVGRAWQVAGTLPDWGARTARERLSVLRSVAPALVSPAVRAAYRRVRRRDGPAHPLLRADDARAASWHFDEWAWIGRRPGPLWWQDSAYAIVDMQAALDSTGYFRRLAADLGVVVGQPLALDQDLVELTMSFPGALSLHADHDRPIARAAAAGRLPDAVRLRAEKSEFSAPLMAAILRSDADVIAGLLRDPGARVRDFVHAGGLSRHLDGSARGEVDAEWCQQTWRLAMVECWLRSLEDSDCVPQLRSRLAGPVVTFSSGS